MGRHQASLSFPTTSIFPASMIGIRHQPSNYVHSYQEIAGFSGFGVMNIVSRFTIALASMVEYRRLAVASVMVVCPLIGA
jgi:hypothetical protein